MLPDYYEVLNISRSATQDEIRTAYKKEALSHPDRLPNASLAETKKATKRFQEVANAHSVLSDPIQRREYDVPIRDYDAHTREYDARTDSSGSPNSTEADAEKVIADVFAELLRPEVERHAPWWSYLGAVCGAGIGFIVGNLPGLMVGAAAGKNLGAIRDAKGKSVAAVLSELGEDQKAAILRGLVTQVLGSSFVY
ncbi:DnaJ domain-containing protein [Mycena capillaripes]|nr:DnaJ domain-containing protein [Mycena capillaripes]